MHRLKTRALAAALTTLTACASVTAATAVLPTSFASAATTSTATVSAKVAIGKAAYTLAGTNVTRGVDELVAYTRTSTQTVTPTNRWGAEVVIVGGKVTKVYDRERKETGPTAIPADGVVLSGHGAARKWLLQYAKLGITVSVPSTTTTAAAQSPGVSVGTASFPLAGTNVERNANELVKYTRTSTQTVTPTNRWGAEVVIVGGKVTKVYDRERTESGPTAIPVDGIVLSGHGTARTWLLQYAKVGATVTLPPTTTPTPTPTTTPTPTAESQAVSVGTSSLALAGTNIARGADQLVLYTRTSTQTVTPTNQWGAEVVLVGGKVTQIFDRQRTETGPTAIPVDGVVLSGHGIARTWLLEHAKVGASVALPAGIAVPEPAPAAAPAPAPEPEPAPTAAPAPAPEPVAPTAATYFEDDFEGPNLSPYIASSLNSTHAKWYSEYGVDPVARSNGNGVKSGSTQFFRMWTQQAVGGPGQSIRIKAKVRTTSIYVRDAGGIVEGTKMWLKWAHVDDEAYPGPASVRGIVDGTSPGSYIYSFHTHNGYSEIMKRAPGMETSSAYTFFKNMKAPYSVGTWEDIEMTFEWLPDSLRIRSYRNGVLQMEAIDTAANRMLIPGHAGIRSDDSKFEIADFRIESF